MTTKQFWFKDREDRTGHSGSYVGLCEYAHCGSVQLFRRVHVDGVTNFVSEAVTLTREQAAHVAAELTRWLEETAPVDPAYEAYAEKSAAAIPATDNEWKDRLVEGGVA